MNRNRSVGINSRGNNRINNNLNRGNDNNLARMNEFDDFDRMFEDFGMPRGGAGLAGLDRVFGNFNSMSRGFRDFENEIFSK
jgi:hypothetical protein